MPLSKCPRCQSVFDKTSTPVCGACVEDEERDYELVRAAVREQPDLSAEALTKTSGVSLACILRMIELGMISGANTGGLVICGRCGAPAISAAKRLCERCLAELNREVLEATRALQAKNDKLIPRDDKSVRTIIDEKRIL